MSNKHKLIPKRRFKEFENADAWEQRKLEDIADVSIGEFVIKSKQNDDAPYPVFNGGKECTGYYDEYNNEANKIVISARGANAGFVNIVEKRFWAGNSCYSISIKDEKMYHLYFLYQFIKFRESLFTEFQQAANIPSVSKKDVLFFSVEHPLFEEQNEIGNFYRALDSLITLHQRKLNKLAEIKSAFLSELFPVPGELKPKRRFAGYLDDWKQYEFADLLDKEDGIRRGPFGSALKKEYFVSKSDYVVYEQQNAIYDRFDTRYYITREKYEELHKFILEPEDFILSGAGTVGRISKVPKNIKKGVFNQALIRIKIEDKVMDPDFFLQWMRSDSMQKKLTYGNPASAIVNLVPIDEIKKWKVIVPSLDEQVKIGNLLNKLDEAIKSQNRKIKKLQNLKESYLNEMFV